MATEGPRHAPYAERHAPFTIGLSPLDPARWIEPDDKLSAELALKRRLFAEKAEAVFQAEAGSEAAQAEILERLAEHLVSRHPDRYRREGDRITVLADGSSVDLADRTLPALLRAAFLVQDDLVLMSGGAAGWRLTAASLSFPSAWRLAEKFGRPMDAIHAPVPGWEGRMAERVRRIFDNLQAEVPVVRYNWSLYDDPELHHPESKSKGRRWAGPDGTFGGDAYIRVERQTLTRLATPDSILFTIRVYVDPVEGLARAPNGAVLARGLREQLLGLTEAQLAYKNMREARDRVAAGLAALAERAG